MKPVVIFAIAICLTSKISSAESSGWDLIGKDLYVNKNITKLQDGAVRVRILSSDNKDGSGGEVQSTVQTTDIRCSDKLARNLDLKFYSKKMGQGTVVEDMPPSNEDLKWIPYDGNGFDTSDLDAICKYLGMR